MYIDLTTNVSQNSPLIQWAKSQDNPHIAMGHIGTHLDTYEKSVIPLEYFKSPGILFDVRGIPEVTEGNVDITLIQQGDCRMFRVKQDTKHADLPEILDLIRTKNQEGFELLYARYYRFLFSTAYLVLRQESDAMDAVQNAALRLYTMDESLFPSDHELAWLHTVVKNEALMVLRKKKPEHSVDELLEIPVPERQLEMLEDMETVQSMLSSLDQKRQNVVTLWERSSGSTTSPSKACGVPSPLWPA